MALILIKCYSIVLAEERTFMTATNVFSLKVSVLENLLRNIFNKETSVDFSIQIRSVSFSIRVGFRVTSLFQYGCCKGPRPH